MTVLTFSSGVANAYVLDAGDGYLVIDTGTSDQYDGFLKALDDAGIAPAEIESLLLTHHHTDHVGFVADLHDEVTVIAHERAAPLLAGGENAREGGGLTNRRVAVLARLLDAVGGLDQTVPPIELRDTDRLVGGRDDEILREFGIEGEVVHLPGHTRDSIGVLLDDGRLFCGDVACNFPRGLGLGHHPLLIADCQALYESWETILDSHAETLYPGHGSPFPAAALDGQLGRFESDDLVAVAPIDDR